jgi:putative transposase
MHLLKNDIYETKAGTRFRLLSVSEDGTNAWVVNISDKGTWPRSCSYAGLMERLEAKDIWVVSASNERALSWYSKAAKMRQKEAWETIAPLVESKAVFDAKHRGPMVAAHAELTGRSATTINKYLRAYWIGGQTQEALLPRFADIGMTQFQGTAGRGRRPLFDAYDVYQMDQKVDDENVRAAVKKHYLNGEVSTLRDAWLKMIRERYSVIDGNGEAFARPSGERPSYRQFLTVAKRLFPLEAVLRGKKGDKDFERDHNMRIGSALAEAVGVGYIYEIDATIADVYLVAQANRSKIIGKPTLYLIYDRYSRLCVGFYVGLENASWEAAMQAILTLAEDKVALCAKYGVEYDPRDWPADKVFPQRFLGDRGEMISRFSNRVCDGMESTIENAPGLAPQRKGTVECGFKMTHSLIKVSTPGYEPPSNVTRRRGKHYETDACLTLEEFIKIILLAIIAHNRREMKNYPLPPDSVLRGELPIPRDIWADDIIHRAGSVSRYTEEHLRSQLLPRGQATVTGQGISFKGCFYTCSEAIERGWFVSGERRRFKVEVSYDRRLVDTIIVHDPRNARHSYESELTTTSARFRGYSFAEVNYIQSAAKKRLSDHADEAIQETIELRSKIEDVATPALKEMRTVSNGKSRTARKADIAVDRLVEKRSRRSKEAAIPHAPLTVRETNSPTNVVSLGSFTAARGEVKIQSTSDVVAANASQRTNPLTFAEKMRQQKQEMINARKL